MTVTELNNYIKHYLEEDKTHTAIMLTGNGGLEKHIISRINSLNFYKMIKRIDVLLFHYMVLKILQI